MLTAGRVLLSEEPCADVLAIGAEPVEAISSSCLVYLSRVTGSGIVQLTWLTWYEDLFDY